jgi:transcriptional regulator with XRE-family HTH domain
MATIEQLVDRQVAAHRKTAGLTQAALAERIGVAVETISRLERGVVIPPVSRLDEIAEVLGVKLIDLFRYSERGRATDHAVDRLVAAVVRRGADDVEVIARLANLVFDHWPTPGGPAARRGKSNR